MDRIVVWHVDRLYRRMRELNDLTDLAQQGRGVMIDPVSGPALNLATADGVMWAQQMVMMAEHESSHKGERVKLAFKRMRKEGLPHGGPRPFGWKDGMTPDPVESKEVIRAVELLFAGASLKDIARRWNEYGLQRPQKPGALWSANTVRLVVSNPRHAGLIAYDPRRVGSYARTVVGEAKWPAIVKRESWEALMAFLETRSRRLTGIPKRRSLLTRLVICGKCETAMTRANDHNMEFYRCPHRRPELPNACGSVSVNARFLEEFLVEATLQRADSGRLTKLLAAQFDKQQSAHRIVENMDELDRRLDQAATMYGKGKLTSRAFETANATITAEQDALRKQLSRMSTASVLAPYAGDKGSLRGAWPSLTQDQQREIISIVIGKVKIMPTAMRGRHVFDHKRVKIARR